MLDAFLNMQALLPNGHDCSVKKVKGLLWEEK
jgi:hypothetical protein